ncbi:uridine 5'-monophosphate synthase-like isoform X1 [Bombus terrestris]|uniref:Uridine 5'-monophosphate synthase n=1 Tax=Bombus terrestris TaxID=30195 RepID=A0A9C6SEW6_BOMTE|nr:uridine 5'-monophosphate synthase-like isoform X1 [Bombus terrestris]XP_048267673.1 uridine 5'-monophosphate synthase-like isoform X1 [Bombus terrestris]
MDSELEQLAVNLFDIGAFKFGEFVTKVGLKTPIYFDLRVLVSHPKIMTSLVRMLLPFVEECPNVARICGVPYAAVPLATLISIDSNVPMLLMRKQTKTYGTKKIIEGKFKPGDSCVIIDDVVTSGSSILETADILRREGLKVTEAFVVIDREQNGKKNIESHGILMRSLYTTTKLMTYLLKANKIAANIVKDVTDYLLISKAPIISPDNRLTMPFHIRAEKCKNAIGSKLFHLMESKQSTICLAADLTKADAVIELADLAGPHIVLLKTHVDILEDFSDNFIKRLKELAKKHDFLLMEDRKFADIENTVCLQYEKGIYKIAQWADVVTVHAIAGQSIIDDFKNSLKNISEPRGLFILAEMSSKGALTIGDYMQDAISIAEISDMVVGVVCQSDIFSSPGLIQLTPGVRILKSTDDLGQQYNTPESVVNSGADLAVVGRGITEAEDKLAATLKYKEELWAAYIKRITL